MEEDIRWKQRFQSFQKAFRQLEKAVNQKSFTDLEREGLIQRFEFTYELAWKTLQDLLQYNGYLDVKGPRPVLEQAFKDGLLTDGAGWMAMKKSRELSSHTYDELTAIEISESILNRYFTLFKQLNNRLESEIR